MESLPGNWHLVEEWNNNFIFENSERNFSVEVTFTEQCPTPYSIGFSQLKGVFTLIGFENGAYTAHALIKSDAIGKAIEMMLFIDKSTKDISVLVQ